MPCAQTRQMRVCSCRISGWGTSTLALSPGWLRLMAQAALHRCQEGGMTEATPWDEARGGQVPQFRSDTPSQTRQARGCRLRQLRQRLYA